MKNKFFKVVEELLDDLENSQSENIIKAGNIVAECIMNGGIVQAFGSGHSYAAAIEICGRAGGLIPSKVITDPAGGMYEMVEGVGEQLVKKADIRKEDCVFLISNSGRNPLGIEIAEFAKRKGAKIIVVTSYNVSKGMTSRHSSGKKLYEFADVILDNRGVDGDASIEVVGLPVKVGGTSSVAAAVLLNATMLHAIETMVSKEYIPPVFMSANVDGGPEFNQKLLDQYADRIYRL